MKVTTSKRAAPTKKATPTKPPAPLTPSLLLPRLDAELLGKPSRKAATAALTALVDIDGGRPLKAALSAALDAAPKLGGGERRFVALAVRDVVRRQRQLDLVLKQQGFSLSAWMHPQDRALLRWVPWRRFRTGADAPRIAVELGLPGPLRPRTVRDDQLASLALAEDAPLPASPDAVEHFGLLASLPGWLARAVAAERKPATLPALATALTEEPSVWLRAREIGRQEELVAQLGREGIQLQPTDALPGALRLASHDHRLFDSAAWRAKRLQVQELGSQAIAALCAPPRGFAGAVIADICAGAGGKSWALADAVGPQGVVHAADAVPRRLEEGRQRLKEARVRNVRFGTEIPWELLDVVLIDAPCSGSGSLAREPDQRWRLTEPKLEALRATQSQLLRDALDRVRPGTLVVYATCSLLPAENEEVVEAELARRVAKLELAGPHLPGLLGPRAKYLSLSPEQGLGGGFFAARLVKR